MARAGLVGVVVMAYLDDVLVVGRGKLNSREQAASLVLHLRKEGANVSFKSTIEPTRRLVCLGKMVDFDTGVLCTVGAAWESISAHWWRLAVGRCTKRRVQQFMGTSEWVCRGGLVTRPLCVAYRPRCYGAN